jgi:hypothetical protein
VLEVGERLCEGEAELVLAQLVREDPAGNLERGRGTAFEGLPHHREALFVVEDELVYASVEVVEERAVPGEDEVYVQAAQALYGVEVALQGTRGRVAPEADVRCDLEQEMVADEEEPPRLIVQDEVEIRMTGGVDYPRLARPELDPVFGLQGIRRSGRRTPSLVVPAVAPAVSGSMPWRIMYLTKSSEPLLGCQTCLAVEISFSSMQTGAPLRPSSQRASPM